jgi:hypothetical protein
MTANGARQRMRGANAWVSPADLTWHREQGYAHRVQESRLRPSAVPLSNGLRVYPQAFSAAMIPQNRPLDSLKTLNSVASRVTSL